MNCSNYLKNLLLFKKLNKKKLKLASITLALAIKMKMKIKIVTKINNKKINIIIKSLANRLYLGKMIKKKDHS